MKQAKNQLTWCAPLTPMSYPKVSKRKKHQLTSLKKNTKHDKPVCQFSIAA